MFNWQIIGHKNIVNFLQKSIINKKIFHAYLFYGSKNVGKTTVAENFVASLFCKSEIKPCQKCIYCQQFFKKIYPDLFIVEKAEDKKNVTIEQIRDLEYKLSLRPFLDSYKVAIIKNAEKMTIEASNALLKTLEEPTSKTIIILISNTLNLPKTIISRSQLIRFSLVPKEEIYNYLIKKTSKKEAEEISSLVLGRPGIAINFLENKEMLEKYKEEAKDFLEILESNYSERIEKIEEISYQTKFLQQIEIFKKLLEIWSLVTRDAILVKNSLNFLTNVFIKEDLKELSQKYNLEKLKGILKEIEKTKIYLSLNISPRLAIENLVLNI